MKRIISLVIIVTLLIGMLFSLSGCDSGNDNENAVDSSNKTSTTAKSSTEVAKTTSSKESEEDKVDYSANAEKQMAMPEKGEQVAIFHIKDYGDVKVKFFPEVAPKAVENFVTHSKEGYYNGLTFHRIIDEFMIQGGDPLGNGTGGESIWGEGFELEVDNSLLPYRGSLCMARSSDPNSNGSQFFITQAHYDETTAKQLSKYPSIVEQYKKYGGYISLWMQYTVFGQVYEGMEVVDKIAQNTKVEDSNGTVAKANQPIISSIDVTTY